MLELELYMHWPFQYNNNLINYEILLSLICFSGGESKDQGHQPSHLISSKEPQAEDKTGQKIV